MNLSFRKEAQEREERWEFVLVIFAAREQPDRNSWMEEATTIAENFGGTRHQGGLNLHTQSEVLYFDTDFRSDWEEAYDAVQELFETNDVMAAVRRYANHGWYYPEDDQVIWDDGEPWYNKGWIHPQWSANSQLQQQQDKDIYEPLIEPDEFEP